MQALLLSPATHYSPDSSTDSLDSPATPPQPSLDFLSPSHYTPASHSEYHTADSDSEWDTPTRPPPTQSTLKQPHPASDEFPTPSTPIWLTDNLGEEWTQPPSHSSPDSPTHIANDTQATVVPHPPSAAPSPAPLATPLPLPLSRFNSAPRVPSSLRHAFTASTATTATDLTATTSASVSLVGEDEEENGQDGETSVLDFGAPKHPGEESVFLLGSSLPPSAGFDGDAGETSLLPPPIDEEEDEEGTSTGTCVVNSIVERSPSSSAQGQGRGGTQLRAAVQALRGPGGGILGASDDGGGEAQQAQGAQAAGVGRMPKAKGLIGLFEPLSPEGGAPPAAHPLPPSALTAAPSLAAFSFSPPPLPAQDRERDKSDLMRFSPSPSRSPPSFSSARFAASESADSTPLARPRFRTPSALRPTARQAEAVHTPSAAATPVPAAAAQQAGRGTVPTGVGRRERFLHRSTTAPVAPAPSPPAPAPQPAAEEEEEEEEEEEASDDDAPFVPPPVLVGEAGAEESSERSDMSTTSSSSSSEDEFDEHAYEGEPARSGVGFGAGAEEAEGFTSEDEEEHEEELPSRDMSLLPSPPSATDLAPPAPAYPSFSLSLARHSADLSLVAEEPPERSSLVPPQPSPALSTRAEKGSLPLPSSPARIPIPSPLLPTPSSSISSLALGIPAPASAAGKGRTAPPLSPYKLFQPVYDTVTKRELASLVDAIDASPSSSSSASPSFARSPSHTGGADQEDPEHDHDHEDGRDQEHEHSEEGFLGAEGASRASKRIKLSPRSEFSSAFPTASHGVGEGDENTPLRPRLRPASTRARRSSFTTGRSARRPQGQGLRSPAVARERRDEAERVMERIRGLVERRERRKAGEEQEEQERVEGSPRTPRKRLSPGAWPSPSRSSLSASRSTRVHEENQQPSDSPPPLPHLAAAASASLRATLGSPAPTPRPSSASSLSLGASSPALGSVTRLPSALAAAVAAAGEGGSVGRRRFARTPLAGSKAKKGTGKEKEGTGKGGMRALTKGVRGLFDPDELPSPAPAPSAPAPATAPARGHARHPSLTTLHPTAPVTQRLLASAGASARAKGLTFDRERGRWIRTPSRLAETAEETEEVREEGAEEEGEEEDPFRDFSDLRSGNRSHELSALQGRSPAQGSPIPIPLERGPLSLSGLGITRGTPPSSSSARVPREAPTSLPRPPSPSLGGDGAGESPAGTNHFSPLPPSARPDAHGNGEGEEVVLELESEDSATWGRGEREARRKRWEGEMRAKELEGQEKVEGEGVEEEEEVEDAETSMLSLYRAAHADDASQESDGAEDEPSVDARPTHRPTSSTPLAAVPSTPAPPPRPLTSASKSTTPLPVPRSALKQPHPQPQRAHSAPDPLSAATATATPLRSFGAAGLDKPPRSVSFSDGKTSGKIEGLVPLPLPLPLGHNQRDGTRQPYDPGHRQQQSPLRFGRFEGGAEGPGGLEFDEHFAGGEDGEGSSDDEADRTVRKGDEVKASARTRRIQEGLEELAKGPDASPFSGRFARDRSTSASSSTDDLSLLSTGLPARRRSFSRTGSGPAANATFLTECSFGVSHDRLLEYITDVEPFEPDWEGLRSIDLSGKKAESVVRMKEFLPSLDEVNLNNNALAYLTGIPGTLRTLLISSNRLTSLTSFRHLTLLERLDLSRNPLESVHQLACLRHLCELKADGCGVNSLEGLEELDALVRVSLKGNELEEVDFARVKWPRVETLHLARNKIASIRNLDKLVSLTSLNLDHNLVTALEPAADMPRLRVLRLCSNPITSLDVSFAPKLRTLYVDSAKLGGVSGTEELRKLENLSVRDQNGGALTLSMPHIRDVKRLYLSGNPLPTSFPSEKFFNLVYLELAMCQLTSLPANLASVVPNVRVLNLDYNFLDDVAPLVGLTRLNKLSVVGARLAKARPVANVLASLVELESVDFRMNPFTLAFYPPLVPSSDGLLPSHATHRILHPESLPSSTSPDSIADPATSSTAWQAFDTKFRRALPDEWYHKRAAYRAVVVQSAPALVRLDGLDCSKDRPRLQRRLEKLAQKRAGGAAAQA